MYIACKQWKQTVINCQMLVNIAWWVYRICASYNLKYLNYIFTQNQRSNWPSAIICKIEYSIQGASLTFKNDMFFVWFYNTSLKRIIPTFSACSPFEHIQPYSADKFNYAGQNDCKKRFENMDAFAIMNPMEFLFLRQHVMLPIT